MMRRRSTRLHACLAFGLSLLVTVAVLPTASRAAAGDPVVGSWATYQWTAAVKEEIPVLIQQPQADGKATWSVTTESVTARPVFVTYSIVRGDAKAYVMQIVTRLTPDGAPLNVTQVTVDRASGKAVRSVIRGPKGQIDTPESGIRPFRQAAIQGQAEEITVPAGRFSAIRGPYKGGTVWVSDQVPALGLVKAALPEGQMELLRSGTSGAQDLLRS